MFASVMPDLLGMPVAGATETIGYAREFGFRGVDLRMEAVTEDPARFKEELARAGLVQGYCSLGWGRVSVAQGEWEQAVARMPELCRRASAMGYTRAAVVVLPGDNELSFGEMERLHVSRVREAMGILGDHGIRLGLEYVAPITRRNGFRNHYIHDLRGALDLIGKIDRAGVGLMLDAFHWYCAGETGEDVRGLGDEQVVVVHACDAMAGRTREEQVVMERELPGDSGVIDLRTFFGALKEIGYSGPVTAEPLNPRWGKMERAEVLRRTGEAVGRFVG